MPRRGFDELVGEEGGPPVVVGKIGILDHRGPFVHFQNDLLGQGWRKDAQGAKDEAHADHEEEQVARGKVQPHFLHKHDRGCCSPSPQVGNECSESTQDKRDAFTGSCPLPPSASDAFTRSFQSNVLRKLTQLHGRPPPSLRDSRIFFICVTGWATNDYRLPNKNAKMQFSISTKYVL